MKQMILILVVVLCTVLKTYGQKIVIPANYTIIDSISGDLDKDGKPELVVAYNTKKEQENESVPRELMIYKLQAGSWTLWKKSSQALYGSRDGGMMGDPFGEISIDKGVLRISHSGGSSWKWGHTDIYRFQAGEFYLIGYTSQYGKNCEYWMSVDFNISTGKMMVTKEYENCEKTDPEIYKRENETVYNKNVKITIQKRNEKEIKIVTPRYKHEIYLAITNE